MNDAAPAAGPDQHHDAPRTPQGAGDRLLAAREAQGLTLADIAARTRVPIRHLEAIESGDYSEMPTPTYAIGFAKAYARAVGEDEVGIARDVRGKTAEISAERQNYQPYELDDPTRVPPRGVALVAGAIAAIVLLGAIIWFGTNWFAGGSNEPSSVAEQAVPPPKPVQSAPVPVISDRGKVVLTALDRVWVRVHDGSGKTLYEGTMNAGDTYEVPADASHPMLTVGRPDQVRITVDGKVMPPLGSGAKPMKDVAIDAGTLAASGNAGAAAPVASAPSPAATTATATPTPAATPTPSTSPAVAKKPAPAPTPKPKTSKTQAAKANKKALNLDLSTTPPPLPTTNGIY